MKRGFLSKTQEYVLLGVIGILVYMILGSFIQGTMLNSAIHNANIYQTSIKPANKDEFNYALDTHAGNILHAGTFEFSILSRFPEMYKEFGAVKRIEEHYNRHERQIAYSCGKDNKNTCYRTEVYYSWDYEGEQVQVHNKIMFEGREYDINNFYLAHQFKNTDTSKLIENVRGKYFDFAWRKRFYYQVIEATFESTIFVDSSDGNMQGIGSKTVSLYNRSPQNMVDDAVNSVGSIQFWFWVFYVGVPIALIVGWFVGVTLGI